MTTIIHDIIEQHFEEAAILWHQRELIARSPIHLLSHLADFDSRLEAHLDGLRIAGADGREDVWLPLVKWADPSEVFSAAAVTFDANKMPDIDALMDSVVGAAKAAADDPEAADPIRGVASALGWLSYAVAAPHIRWLLASNCPVRRRAGISAAAIHRQDPAAPLQVALKDPNPKLRARACKAAGELGKSSLLPQLRSALRDADSAVRFFAAESAARLSSDAAALTLLRQIGETDPQFARRALQTAARRLPLSAAMNWHSTLAKNPETMHLAILTTGAIGDPAAIPWLIDCVGQPAIARHAGEAFSLITGIDLPEHRLVRKGPPQSRSRPTADPTIVRKFLGPDQNLPWPDAEGIAKWWKDNSGSFPTGTRHLLGKPITIPSLQEALRKGRQRQRAAAALEMAIQQPVTPLFEVRSPGFRQRQLLG